jgi:hypothetical protein
VHGLGGVRQTHGPIQRGDRGHPGHPVPQLDRPLEVAGRVSRRRTRARPLAPPRSRPVEHARRRGAASQWWPAPPPRGYQCRTHSRGVRDRRGQVGVQQHSLCGQQLGLDRLRISACRKVRPRDRRGRRAAPCSATASRTASANSGPARPLTAPASGGRPGGGLAAAAASTAWAGPDSRCRG